jgi:hypothetical protein
VLHSHL